MQILTKSIATDAMKATHRLKLHAVIHYFGFCWTKCVRVCTRV
jgi:hypothetical protein